jgi:cobalt-precorrin-5B (C1)-methyltransferase
LPQGKRLNLPLSQHQLISQTNAVAAITKDGGDDPDITTGLDIIAEVSLNDSGEIEIYGGQGVGTVTLKGLKIPPGEAAINPVPRDMIKRNVLRVLPQGMGAIVTISAPGGEELAKRTFNPRLGIMGGISILGSTGIVNPMSEDALKESLRLELSILVNKGAKTIIFAFGNYGMQFLRDHKINDTQVVKISNFIGFMLDQAMELGVKQLIVSGHIGKLAKVSAGIFHTHSRVADSRMEIMTAYAALEGASQDVLQRIYAGKTTSVAVEEIEAADLTGVYKRIAENAAKRCETYTYGEIEVGTILFGDESRLLYIEDKARRFLAEMQAEAAPNTEQ